MHSLFSFGTARWQSMVLPLRGVAWLKYKFDGVSWIAASAIASSQ